MADPIEHRAAALERGMRELQDFCVVSDQPLDTTEAELQSSPDLDNLEFRRFYIRAAQGRAEMVEYRDLATQVGEALRVIEAKLHDRDIKA